jgi:chorismate synthase
MGYWNGRNGVLRLLTSGESHGPGLAAILEGIPAGLIVDLAEINAQLAKRQQGYGRGRRQTIEHDTVEVLSGIRHGRTLPGPITLVIRNRDFETWRERMSAAPVAADGTKVVCPRPGHADLAGVLKYELTDIRDVLERSSARATAALVAAGAVCRILLREAGVRVCGYVRSIGACDAPALEPSELEARQAEIDGSPVRCADPEAAARMVAAIDEAASRGDTLGGVVEIVAIGCPPGLGSHTQWDRRLDARLAAALMSIQAVKGVEIGAGFAGAALPGSSVHDELLYDDQAGLHRSRNNAGGIEGGMSNGEPIVVRCAMKPLPTLKNRLRSVDLTTREAVQAHFERSDVCAVPAASVIGEAMMAYVLADALIERFGGDSIQALRRNMAATAGELTGRGYTGNRWSPR